MLAHSLKRARIERRVSLEELAAATNIPEDQLYIFENSEETPTITQLETIANALRCHIASLLGCHPMEVDDVLSTFER